MMGKYVMSDVGKEIMLSIEQCRELLGEDAKGLTDLQIEKIRGALYVLGNNVLDRLFNIK